MRCSLVRCACCSMYICLSYVKCQQVSKLQLCLLIFCEGISHITASFFFLGEMVTLKSPAMMHGRCILPCQFWAPRRKFPMWMEVFPLATRHLAGAKFRESSLYLILNDSSMKTLCESLLGYQHFLNELFRVDWCFVLCQHHTAFF